MKARSLAVCALLVLVQTCGGSPRVDPLVASGAGLMQGVTSPDGTYSMFLGVPYATVDKEKPFGDAIPHPGFNETFVADDDSAICPQVRPTGLSSGTLDCLNLNIFVPNEASTQHPLPVMVYIHGGAWAMDGGTRDFYLPEYLIKKGVILVTLNYRVQIYGFMCLGTEEVPGNQGLKDQLLALRWIKQHIQSFGGNQDKITIFGQSAGGMSVHLQILSPYEKVFHRAIIMSGVWDSPWAIVEPDVTIPVRLATHLGYQTDDYNEALTYLATVDPLVLVKATSEINTVPLDQPNTKPCVEKQYEGVEHFILDYPFNATPVEARKIPIMIGYTNNELLFEFANKADDFYENFSIDVLLKFGLESDDFSQMIDYVKYFYVGDKVTANDTKDGLINLGSDFLFNHPTERALKRYLELGGQVYQYLFTYDGELNWTKKQLNITSPDIAHADDLGYLFHSPQFPAPTNDEDTLMVDRMVTLWTNFAKFGNPTPEVTELLPVTWQPVTSSSRNYLELNKELIMKRSPLHSRMAFWELFYKTYGDHELGRKG